MTDFSNMILHDPEHVPSNTTQAMKLWAKSGLDEGDFIALLHQAKQITQSHTGSIKKTANGFRGTKNRAPYFFGVLKDLMNQARLKDLKSSFPKTMKLGF
jgi:hypothetical protein